MKKLFTAFALGAISLAAAAAPSFENYTADPEAGIVTELSVISVAFPGCEEIEINHKDAIVLYNSSFDEMPGSASMKYGSNALSFTLDETVTAPGEYILVIAADAITGYDADYDSLDLPEDIYITYNIEGEVSGGGEVNYLDYTSEPAEGEVSSLKNIVVTFPNIADLDFNHKNDIKFAHNGTDISGTVIKGGDNLSVTLPEEQTAPGTYTLTIPAGACCGFNSDYSDYLDNPEDIVLTWTIRNAADAVDFTYTVTPAVNSTVASLSQLTLDFAGLDEVTLTGGGLMSVTVNGEPLNIVEYGVSDGEKPNQMLVVFSPAIESESDDKAVEVTFPAGSLTGKKDAASGTNSAAVTLAYTVAPKVVYDLVATLSTPTKPNAAGEISADKQIDAFFFSVNAVGLVAAEGTEANVTIREVNGDFLATAHLNKANGLDQNLSYFAANFGRQPQYNGEYEVTIEKGAFGDERWGRDHQLGHSNEAITLKFILVDGQDYMEYNLEPSEVTPAEGAYATGAEFATITVKFAESGVVLSEAEMLYANLAGIDNDYNESATFTAGADGSFTATFPAPTAKGTYKFTVLSGAFSLDNRRNPEIQREYKLDENASAIEIELDSNVQPQIYNLQGMPVNGKLPAGIYIVNGKKVRI